MLTCATTCCGALIAGNKDPPKPGYSDRELNAVVRAARADVAAIRDRIRAGWELVARYRENPQAVPDDDRVLAEQLANIAETGCVPPLRGFYRAAPRRALAAHLFLTAPDLCPLMVLLVALTGRNIETIKELPAEHRILMGRAVELRVVKRRRGRAGGIRQSVGKSAIAAENYTARVVCICLSTSSPHPAGHGFRHPNGFGQFGATPSATPSRTPPSARSASTAIPSPNHLTTWPCSTTAGSPNMD
jgi:hypothetical protein